MAKNRRNLLIEDEVLYEVRSIFVLAFQVVSRSVDEAIEGPECVGERQGGGGDSPGVLSPATGPDGYSAHRKRSTADEEERYGDQGEKWTGNNQFVGEMKANLLLRGTSSQRRCSTPYTLPVNRRVVGSSPTSGATF